MALASPVVASGHPAVSDAGFEILRAGGNAFDAAVAAGFAATAAEPALASLGGGGFLLARPASGPARLFDFFADLPGRGCEPPDRTGPLEEVFVRFPGSLQRFLVGRGSVATPGTLAGLLRVHERLGRFPLPEVVAPALALAREGVEITEAHARVQEMLGAILTREPGSREIFAPRGAPLQRGERLVNPPLAAFLEGLPDTASDFYRGALGRALAGDIERAEGRLTSEDLACYAVVERSPLRVTYRGCSLLANPAPSLGGPLLGHALAVLAAERGACAGFAAPERVLALLRAMREAERARDQWSAGLSFSRGTTHLSVCDGQGNLASMTTSNGEGSGYVLPGTGIMLNNMLGEDDLVPQAAALAEPGTRIQSMMSPVVLERPDGCRFAFGSGGSKRIRSTLLQAVNLLVDTDLELQEVVDAPRIHWDETLLQVEPGLSRAQYAALRSKVEVNEWPVRDLYFGGLQVVSTIGTAAADPRRSGATRP